MHVKMAKSSVFVRTFVFVLTSEVATWPEKKGPVPSPPGCYILVALLHKVDMILNAVFPEIECDPLECGETLVAWDERCHSDEHG